MNSALIPLGRSPRTLAEPSQTPQTGRPLTTPTASWLTTKSGMLGIAPPNRKRCTRLPRVVPRWNRSRTNLRGPRLVVARARAPGTLLFSDETSFPCPYDYTLTDNYHPLALEIGVQQAKTALFFQIPVSAMASPGPQSPNWLPRN